MLNFELCINDGIFKLLLSPVIVTNIIFWFSRLVVGSSWAIFTVLLFPFIVISEVFVVTSFFILSNATLVSFAFISILVSPTKFAPVKFAPFAFSDMINVTLWNVIPVVIMFTGFVMFNTLLYKSPVVIIVIDDGSSSLIVPLY